MSSEVGEIEMMEYMGDLHRLKTFEMPWREVIDGMAGSIRTLELRGGGDEAYAESDCVIYKNTECSEHP